MRLTLSAVTVIAATLAAGAAFAEDSPSCGNAPESQWMSKDAIKAKAEQFLSAWLTDPDYPLGHLAIADGWDVSDVADVPKDVLIQLMVDGQSRPPGVP